MTSPTSPPRRATGTDKLLVEVSGKIALVTINNPQKRNALSREIREALPGVLAALDADPDVRVLVVTGAGDKAFASGATSPSSPHCAQRPRPGRSTTAPRPR